jgi:hypothetical protein
MEILDNMSKMTFSDGVTFDTDGPYRVEHRHDGYYLVGGGMLCPVNSYEEGYTMARSLKERDDFRAKAAEESSS